MEKCLEPHEIEVIQYCVGQIAGYAKGIAMSVTDGSIADPLFSASMNGIEEKLHFIDSIMKSADERA